MDKEIIAHIYKNKNNNQYNLFPMKRNCSKDVLQLLSDPNVIGLKLQIIKAYIKDTMPKPILLTPEELKIKGNERCRKYYHKHKELNK